MKMSRAMLIELLYPGNSRDESGEFWFSRLQMLLSDAEDPDTLFLTDRDAPEGCLNILRLGSVKEINRAFCVFQSYYQWREELWRLAFVEHDLKQLLEQASSFLQCDLSIVSPDYWIDMYAIHYFEELYAMRGQMSTSDIEVLYEANPHFDDTYNKRGIQKYAEYDLPHATMYYYNFFQETLFLGRLLFLVSKDRVGRGMEQIMEVMCTDAEHCYRYLYLHRQGQHPEYKLYDLWKGILRDEAVERSEVKRCLDNRGWKTDDQFQILFLKPVGYGQSIQTLKYYAVLLESTFSETVAAEMDSGLYCLRNLSRDHMTDHRQQLGEFLRDNLFHAGISNPFQDIFNSKRYCIQAEEALRCGAKRDPSLWRYAFSDYALEYILDHSLGEFPAADYCPDNLRTILDYDKSHPDSALLETLYQYYANQFQVQAAADKLFIHRTTFFYRMNKIQRLAQFHPDDLKETCQIMLALYALRAEQ